VTDLRGGNGTPALLSARDQQIAYQILKEIEARVNFLNNVGLGYLSLARSAGSFERRRSAAYPAGDPDRQPAHRSPVRAGRAVDWAAPARQRKLIHTLMDLRDLGNTLLVVEHDEETMRMATT